MTAEAWATTETHRRAQVALAAQAAGEIASLWPLLDPGDLDRSFPLFARGASGVIAARRSLSATLAGRYYGLVRAQDGVAGTAQTFLADRIEPERLLTSLRVTGPVTWKRALARGAEPAAARNLAQAQVTRAATRLILDGGRETVLQTMLGDDAARGYQRVSDGRPCAFCAMLVSRGAVYKSEATGGFRSHDGCGCSVRPFWERTPEETAQAIAYRSLWNESGANFSGDRAVAEFRRAYNGAYPLPKTPRPKSITKAVEDAVEESPAPSRFVSTAPAEWTELSKADAARRFALDDPSLDPATAVPKLEATLAETTRKRAASAERIEDLRSRWIADGYPGDTFERDSFSYGLEARRLADLDARISATEEFLRAVRAGEIPPSVLAAAEKHAKAYRVFVRGPHEFHVRRDYKAKFGVTDEVIERALRELDETLDALPEWRRFTADGTERRYRVFVDGAASKAKALGYTFRGNDGIWMNPSLLQSGAEPVARGARSMPSHMTVSPWRYTLTHEFGHTVDFLDDPAVKAAFADLKSRPEDFARLSTYGQSKATEAYAEAFAEWVLGDRSNPAVAYFARVFGWDLPSDAYAGVWRAAPVRPIMVTREGRRLT